jgi:dGTPase
MKNYGGFEHNLQSLRVVDKLEEKYADFPGLNLTYETREGILKHCSAKNAAELGDVGERFMKKLQPGLEAQLTNLADEIAYNSHDVDDGLRAELINIDQLIEIPLFYQQYQEVKGLYPDLSQRRIIHEIVRRLINCQVTDLVQTSMARLELHAPADLDAVRQHPEALIAFSDQMRELNLELKRFLRNHLYRHYRVHRMSAKAERVICALFEAFFNDPLLMPDEAQLKVAELKASAGDSGRARAVADYIAGMTDRYAIKEHARVYHPGELT